MRVKPVFTNRNPLITSPTIGIDDAICVIGLFNTLSPMLPTLFKSEVLTQRNDANVHEETAVY